MTAREYLGQVKRIDAKLENYLQEIEYWNTIAASPGGMKLDAVRVQSSPNPNKMADAAAMAVEYSQKAEELYCKGIQVKKTILDQLDGMEDYKSSKILRLYFINGQNISAISKLMCYDPRHGKRLFKKALIAFEKQYGKEIMSPNVPQMSP